MKTYYITQVAKTEAAIKRLELVVQFVSTQAK
jgi:hypothetical protein